jgi:hypothetical protein
MQNRILETTNFQLEYDPFGRLVFVGGDGQRHVGITPVRGFPITDREHGVALLDGDAHELAWVDNLAELPASTRETIEAELVKREFVPHIRRILRVSMQTEPCEWEVETDRGRTTFVLKSEDDVRQLDGRRAMVIDAHGIRYLIPDTSQLDRLSRRTVERYL